MSEPAATRYTDVGTDYIFTERLDDNADRIGFPQSVSRAMAASRLLSGSQTARAHAICPPEVVAAVRGLCDLLIGSTSWRIDATAGTVRAWLDTLPVEDR